MPKDYAPCKLLEYPEDFGDPRFAITFNEFERREVFFEEKGLTGGGYTWHGVVEALIRMHQPELLESLEFDPEGSMFCVRSSNLDALDVVAGWINKSLADTAVLEDAVNNADAAIIE